MVVGTAAGDVGVAAIAGAVVEAGPAVGKGTASGRAASGFRLEVLSVGQGEVAAGGAEVVDHPETGVASTADGTHPE